MSSTDLPDQMWRKSSYSNGQANCVEVATMADGQTGVRVRDSKAAGASGLIFPARAWRQFTDSVKLRGTRAGLHDNVRQELPAGPFSRRCPSPRPSTRAPRRPERPVRSAGHSPPATIPSPCHRCCQARYRPGRRNTRHTGSS